MGHTPSDTQLRSLLTEFDFDGSGARPILLATMLVHTIILAGAPFPPARALTYYIRLPCRPVASDLSILLGALDPLEFTALMSRMLGYRELPAEQMHLLKGVFDYVDIDSNGSITQAQIEICICTLQCSAHAHRTHNAHGTRTSHTHSTSGTVTTRCTRAVRALCARTGP